MSNPFLDVGFRVMAFAMGVYTCRQLWFGYVEMGQFTDAGSINTSWHRICTKDLNVLGSWGFTGNDLPLGVDMLYRTAGKYPWLKMQTIYPFTEDGVAQAVRDAMAMKTVKSTIVPWPELVE